MLKPCSLHHAATHPRHSDARNALLAMLIALFAIMSLMASSRAHAAPNDFDKDAKSDLVLSNGTGVVELWLMNGITASSKNTLLNAPGWIVTHMADFNGDGRTDILFRHTDGRVALWLMNGATFIGGAGLIEAGAGWSVTHVGDFNGDGKADILFRHTDGRVAMWLMNGTTLVNGAGLIEAGTGWSVSHTGDFNGDGKADILFRHTDGRVAMWLMNGLTLSSGGGLLEAASGWSVTHTGDFNGDGKTDLVFRHTDGRIAMWLMNGLALSSGAGLLDAASGWSTTHVADFNGDGKADLLFRHADGRVAMWLMNGVALTSGAGLLNAASGWSVTHTGDFNGDGKADLVFLHTDGRIAIWLMNGITLASGGGLTDANAGLQVAPNNDISAQIANLQSVYASRFLAQATFGARMVDIDALKSLSPADWLNTQFAKPQTLHLPQTSAYLSTLTPDNRRGQTGFIWSMWRNFSSGDDQLRQRMAFALSEIMVISLNSDLSLGQPYGVSNYLDMLGANAFGNYRTLLQDVTYSPMMGIYLTHIRNRKENPTTGAVPDENYAREIMQLMTIGLYQLNLDGTQKLDSANKPIDTYSNADISGLAKVFTGLSWAGPDTTDSRFRGGGGNSDVPDHQITPMQAYNQFHSISQKQFLGVTIPATTVADTNADIKIALDTLFNHPNVGPFFGKQLIQRLVTANPSREYVTRVANAFNNNGLGVRGDMRTVIRAVLLDPEARNPGVANTSGKLREPVIRFVHWMRSFNARSQNGQYLFGTTSNPSTALAQSPMSAPSVFNFFRPGYIPPNSKIGALGLVSPEAQITHETSIAGYLNFMRSTVERGVGTTQANGTRDIIPDYTQEIALASDADKLIDRVSLLLTAGAMSANTRAQIRTAINSVPIRAAAADAETDRRNRVYLAVYLTMASTDYILQN